MEDNRKDLRLVVGLGNPGKEYEYTRHNLGFLVVRYLAEQLKVQFKSKWAKAISGNVHFEGCDVHLLMPLTYMNHSGFAVKEFLTKHPIGLDQVLVVCDDLSLEFGRIRARPKGADGGHNGLTSIIESLTTNEFPRLRMGIGQPPSKAAMVDYVLGEFTTSEKKDLTDFVELGAKACLTWLTQGVGKTMDQFNKV